MKECNHVTSVLSVYVRSMGRADLDLELIAC